MSELTEGLDLLMLCGTGAVLYIGIPFLRNSKLRERGIQTYGVVTSHSVPDKGQVVYSIEYTTQTGETHKYVAGSSSMPPGVGAAVLMLYDPEKPSRAAPSANVDPHGRKARIFLSIAGPVTVAAVAVRIVLAFM
ncbi:DUF3592 domain-containing protein [Streptomyces misionensis]